MFYSCWTLSVAVVSKCVVLIVSYSLLMLQSDGGGRVGVVVPPLPLF